MEKQTHKIEPGDIFALLDAHHIKYKILEHEPTPTSADSARVRNMLLSAGAKALLLKHDKGFVLCVIPANRKLDAAALRIFLSTKNLRFATEQELFAHGGLMKGAVPPFGELLGVKTIVDPVLYTNEMIGFNVASLTVSVIMTASEYQVIVSGTEAAISFTQESHKAKVL